MRQVEPQPAEPIRALDWRKIIPFQAVASSDRLRWVGLEAARFRASPAWEYNAPALTHHRLVLVTRPPQELDLRFEGVKRHVPPPAGAVILVPAGTPGQVRWSGGFDWFHIYLEPALVERVAAEAFDLDPKRVVVPPLANLQLPPLRATMEAVNAELTTGGARGPRQGRRRSNIPAMRRRQRQPAARRRDRSPGHRTTERGQVRAAPPRYRCCRLPRREDGGHRHEG